MGISKISRNYQVTLPKDVRELKNFKIGDKIVFIVDDGHVELAKINKKIISDVAGLWDDMKETGIEYERRLRKKWKKRTY